MKTRRRFLERTTFLGGSLLFLRGEAGAATFEYKLGHDLSESTTLGVAANEFAAAVRRESQGRLAVKVFPNSTLGGDASMVTQLRSGALEMHLQGVGPLSAVAPAVGIGQTGFAFNERRDAIAAMEGALGAVIRKELELKDLVVFEASWAGGFHEITTWNKPIRTADDLMGLKIRAPLAPIVVELLRAFGSSAVPLDVSEMYSALQTHIVDGISSPVFNVLAAKVYEVQKYLSMTNHLWVSYWFLMNSQSWKTLPPDIQNIVRRNANLYGKRQRRADELQIAATQDVLVRYGLKVNSSDSQSFRRKLGGYYAHWKSEFGPAAWAALETYSGKLG